MLGVAKWKLKPTIKILNVLHHLFNKEAVDNSFIEKTQVI